MEAMSTVGNERLTAVVGDVLSALHEVLERHQVTEQEWMAALAYLTEVGRADEFILLSDVTRTSVLIDALSHAGDETGATASDVEGPLYVDDPPFREGTPAKIYEEYEGMGDADVLLIGGTVTSTSGGPLPEAIVDVWQTGPDGGYDIWDERQPEYNFRGKIRPADDGSYQNQTRLPKPYNVPTEGPVGRYLEAVGQHPWRPAHIHFKVTAPGHRTLVTQVFFPDDPYLDNDTIGAVKPALVRPVERRGEHLGCDFDIALAPAG
jgi:protocatechuate 3,4-dioxygenase beta subunit